MTELNDDDESTSPAKFSTWIYPAYRRYRLGLLSIPALERNLALELETFSLRSKTVADSRVELTYVKNSLETVRGEVRRTAAGLVALINALQRSKISNQDLSERIEKALENNQDREAILRHINHAGGIGSLHSRALSVLRARHTRYVEAIELLGRMLGNPDRELGDSVLGLQDLLAPADRDDPQVTYFAVLCLIKPLICVVVVVVLVVLEDEIDPDPPTHEDEPSSEPGDFPEPDPDDGVPA